MTVALAESRAIRLKMSADFQGNPGDMSSFAFVKISTPFHFVGHGEIKTKLK